MEKINVLNRLTRLVNMDEEKQTTISLYSNKLKVELETTKEDILCKLKDTINPLPYLESLEMELERYELGKQPLYYSKKCEQIISNHLYSIRPAWDMKIDSDFQKYLYSIQIDSFRTAYKLPEILPEGVTKEDINLNLISSIMSLIAYHAIDDLKTFISEYMVTYQIDANSTETLKVNLTVEEIAVLAKLFFQDCVLDGESKSKMQRIISSIIIPLRSKSSAAGPVSYSNLKNKMKPNPDPPLSYKTRNSINSLLEKWKKNHPKDY